MANTESIETLKTTTTLPVKFFNAVGGKPLFSVCEGLPLEEAITQASTLLSTAIQSAYTAADNDDSQAAYSSAYVCEMAKAIIDSIALGIQKEKTLHKEAA